MVAVAPIAIVASAIVTAVLLLYAAWDAWGQRALGHVKGWGDLLNRAGITTRAEDLVLSVLGIVAILWIGLVAVLRPPFIVSMLLLAAFLSAGCVGLYAWSMARYQRRRTAFIQQLELALRLLGGGLRVGLGLRQALALSLEELPEPARHEFTRVVGQTNLGVSAYDALDALAERMPGNDTLMMARVIRIQSQTGGDLARVLEHLAGTIKERRRMDRKKRAITAEGRASAIILCAIPIALGTFLVLTQPGMSHALLFTAPGHVVIITIGVLELLAILTMRAILRNMS